MRSLRAQYFFAFAVMGALLPYLPIYLRGRGLSETQVGWAQSVTGLAVLVSPVLMTLAADLRVANRRLLLWVFTGCGLAGAALAEAESFWPLVIAYGLMSVALAPVTSLQDGLNFAEQDRRLAMGRPRVAYHRVRVYGTLGFIAPSLALYFVIQPEQAATPAVWTAVAFCVFGFFNTFALPSDHEAQDRATRTGLPTLAAAKGLLEPHLLVFCLAMWLCQLAVAGYYGFYPIYLTETIGIEPKWIGLISSIGVTIEIGFVLGFGWLLRKCTLRGLMVLGVLAMSGRLLLLWWFPNVWVAVGVQVLHGIMVVVVHIAPPIYLNRRAEPRYRNSMLGLYSMAVHGTGRLIGIAGAGYLAAQSVGYVFAVGALLCVLSVLLFIFAFHGGDVEA